jgi:hypothetical protein
LVPTDLFVGHQGLVFSGSWVRISAER